jgi:hypothetical protein
VSVSPFVAVPVRLQDDDQTHATMETYWERKARYTYCGIRLHPGAYQHDLSFTQAITCPTCHRYAEQEAADAPTTP